MRRKILLSLAGLAWLLATLSCAGLGSDESTVAAEPSPQWSATFDAFQSQLEQLEGASLEPTPEVYGMWLTEDDNPIRTSQVLVITPESMYRVRTFDPQMMNPQAFARETYYEVIEHDEENGHMTVRIRWIRVNGEFGGFDSPTALMTYQVDGDVLRLALSNVDTNQFPEVAGSVEYYRR